MSQIYESFLKTKKSWDAHQEYPRQPGIYALFLVDKVSLEIFGRSGQLIYVGIAKEDLQGRIFDQHFNNGQTGHSTLRRSLGAILEKQLKLTSIPRGGPSDSKRFDCYKFADAGEEELTNWMKNNLEIGYWEPDRQLTYQELRDVERKVTIELKPTLDLDPRTRKYNPLANKLSGLRKICKAEASKFTANY